MFLMPLDNQGRHVANVCQHSHMAHFNLQQPLSLNTSPRGHLQAVVSPPNMVDRCGWAGSPSWVGLRSLQSTTDETSLVNIVKASQRNMHICEAGFLFFIVYGLFVCLFELLAFDLV